MSDQHLPIVEQLADASDHAARAAWLLSCPIGVLTGHAGAIRAVLRQAGFLYGVIYLEDIGTVASSTRVDGGWSEAAGEILEHANAQMRAVIAAAEIGGDDAGA